MEEGSRSVGRRQFDRRIAQDQREALFDHLRSLGVPELLIEGEHDVTGLAADVHIRGLERLTLLEAAAEAGMDPDEARHVWHIVGVAVGDDDDATFTPADVQVLRFYAAAGELFGETSIQQVLRVVGSAFMRVAEAEVAMLRLAYEIPFLESGGSDIELTDGYGRLSRLLLPEVEAVFSALHRLHLARASRRAWAVDDSSGATLARLAVGFADLAGFTSLSARVTPGELAGIVDAFDEQVGEVVVTHGGHVVKLIGDEVMFAADRAADALAIARQLATGLSGAERLPGVRVGLAAGEVLNRDGDYYGSVVNLAARLVAVAEPGEVLLDRGAADAAEADDDELEPLEPVEVKGFPDLVPVFRLRG